jgi:hypothetical protein
LAGEKLSRTFSVFCSPLSAKLESEAGPNRSKPLLWNCKQGYRLRPTKAEVKQGSVGTNTISTILKTFADALLLSLLVGKPVLSSHLSLIKQLTVLTIGS